MRNNNNNNRNWNCCCKTCVAFILKFLNLFQLFLGFSIILYSVYTLNYHCNNHHFPDSDQLIIHHLSFTDGVITGTNSPWFIYAFMGLGVTLCCVSCTGHIAAESINGCCLSFVSFSCHVNSFSFYVKMSKWCHVIHCIIYIHKGGTSLWWSIGWACVSKRVKLPRGHRFNPWFHKKRYPSGHRDSPALTLGSQSKYTLLKTVFILLEVALILFIALDRHWERDLPSDPTGEIDRLREFVESNIDFCSWIGITVIVIQVLCLLLAIVLRAMMSPKDDENDIEKDDDVRGKAWEPLLNPRTNQTLVSVSGDGKAFRSDVWGSRMREKYGLSSSNIK